MRKVWTSAIVHTVITVVFAWGAYHVGYTRAVQACGFKMSELENQAVQHIIDWQMIQADRTAITEELMACRRQIKSIAFAGLTKRERRAVCLQVSGKAECEQ